MDREAARKQACAVTATQIAELLGISASQGQKLCRDGFFGLRDISVHCVKYYHQGKVESLLKRLDKSADNTYDLKKPQQKSLSSLLDAVHESWGATLSRVLVTMLQNAIGPDDVWLEQPGLMSFRYSRASISRITALARTDNRMTTEEACRVLGCSKLAFAQLKRSSFFQSQFTIEHGECRHVVETFAASSISTSDVARHVGISPVIVYEELKARGLTPIFDGGRSQFCWWSKKSFPDHFICITPSGDACHSQKAPSIEHCKGRPPSKPCYPSGWQRPISPALLTNTEWTIIQPYLRETLRTWRSNKLNCRQVMDTILYRLITNCKWQDVPSNLLRRTQVRSYFRAWLRDSTITKVCGLISAERGYPFHILGDVPALRPNRIVDQTES